MSDQFDLEAKRAAQAQARAEAARLAGEPTVPERIAAIVACELCDDDGYCGVRVCDHRPHSTPEGRAAAKASLERALRRNHTSNAPIVSETAAQPRESAS